MPFAWLQCSDRNGLAPVAVAFAFLAAWLGAVSPPSPITTDYAEAGVSCRVVSVCPCPGDGASSRVNNDRIEGERSDRYRSEYLLSEWHRGLYGGVRTDLQHRNYNTGNLPPPLPLSWLVTGRLRARRPHFRFRSNLPKDKNSGSL
jgi:hypothetical protein